VSLWIFTCVLLSVMAFVFLLIGIRNGRGIHM
jgi:hypothetical protein